MLSVINGMSVSWEEKPTSIGFPPVRPGLPSDGGYTLRASMTLGRERPPFMLMAN